MKSKKEKPDKTITMGELFELAWTPLILPEENNTKRKRRTGEKIVVKLALGSENYKPDPKVTANILIQAIERKAEALYEATGGKLPMGPGKPLKKFTLNEIKFALSSCFLWRVEERLKGNSEKE